MAVGPLEAPRAESAGHGIASHRGVLVLLAATIAVCGVADLWHAEIRVWIDGIPAAWLRWLSDSVVRPVKWAITGNFLSPVFLVLFPVLFLLECWRPARPEQPLLSAGFLCDALWVPVGALGKAIFVFGWIGFLDGIWDRHLGFLAIGALHELPWIARVACGLILVDLINYGTHRLLHRVPLFWEFHAIHHAQREVNFLTERRIHFVDALVDATIYVVPAGVFGLDAITAGALATFDMWQSRFAHSNVRTHLGPLRWILVTPQSHRIHHGRDPRFHNRNFGSLFTVWDRLFGTQHYGWDDYPESGIEDERFPIEQGENGLRFLLTPLLQTLHPFRRIARGQIPGSGPRPARAS